MSEETTRRFLPPRGIWILFVVCLALATWLQISQATGDRGATNVTQFGLFLICALTAGVWFTFFSAFDKKLRLGVPGALGGYLVVFVSLFRMEGVAGEMAPQFVWRFNEIADRALELPPTASAERIDLVTTGPWDFPQFLGPTRDLSVAAVVLSRDWDSQPPELIWRQPIGAGWSGFAVVNGYAITQEQRGDLEMITCYEVETGELVWSHSRENRFDSFVAGIGPRATPTIDEGIVYALTASGVLLAINGADGAVLWEHDLPADYGLSPEQELATILYGRANSPLVVGPLVIVPAGGLPSGRLT
jgi:outer membrane protein assembly factor BamB